MVSTDKAQLQKALLDKVKSYLYITFDDDKTDSKLSNIIERGMKKISHYAGVELFFEKENEEMALLLDYCRYAYNNAFEYFEENFRSEIISLRLKYKLKRDEEDD